MRERRDLGPVILKYGVAVALSLGGVLYTILRNKGIKPSKSTPILPPSTDYDHSLQTTPCACTSGSMGSKKRADLTERKDDGVLLPEFNEIVRDFNLASTPTAGFSPRKDVDLKCQVSALREYISVERDGHDEEVRRLKGIVKTLKERERALEIKLLEYYGLKEQETVVMELQNRINFNNMETKLLALKIESLKADKKRLEAQGAEYTKVVSELEAARMKIKQLKKKLRHEAENRKEQMCALQEKVMKLHGEEKKVLENLHHKEKKVLEKESEVRRMLQRIADLELEAEELRGCNNSLRIENSELAQRLEYVQIIATSALDEEEMDALTGEAERLRKQNEDMAKEIEQLQSDRSADAEELVYLRWVNACLRYELRNYQSDPSKTVARDLSKSSSPNSEERAKQLILEYAHKEGVSPDFSSGWSSSQASLFTESVEPANDDNSSTTTRKSGKRKVFGKLMKLIRGKGKSGTSSSDSSFRQSVNRSKLGSYQDEEGMCRNKSPHRESFHKSELEKYAEVLKEGRSYLPPSRSRRSASFGSLA
ncbi:unnamed protein product [Cuscuta epithymum]|uniref:Protein CHUP1, chloroplastic-like n=1 Tax=Cuscuta epithymum TaxID=186058 RepID=A0AAV0F9S1_9ASTE|nr:unnamed protein product [Cuscuta epithymum]